MKTDNLSKAELEIIKVLWKLGDASVYGIQEALNSTRSKDQHLAYTTIATMLRRMEEKGAVLSHKEGRSYIFQPTEELSEYKSSKLKDFVGQFFEGRPSSLASYFIENSKFSEEELVALSKLIDEKKYK